MDNLEQLSQEIQKFTSELMQLLNIPAAVTADVLDSGNHMAIFVNINVAEPHTAKVIGFHGKTIEALRIVIGSLLRVHNEKLTLLLDINGYSEEFRGRVSDTVSRAVDQVKLTNLPIAMEPMNALQRRITHLEVQKYEGVVSESEGERGERRVVIKPKSEL